MNSRMNEHVRKTRKRFTFGTDISNVKQIEFKVEKDILCIVSYDFNLPPLRVCIDLRKEQALAVADMIYYWYGKLEGDSK